MKCTKTELKDVYQTGREMARLVREYWRDLGSWLNVPFAEFYSHVCKLPYIDDPENVEYSFSISPTFWALIHEKHFHLPRFYSPFELAQFAFYNVQFHLNNHPKKTKSKRIRKGEHKRITSKIK